MLRGGPLRGPGPSARRSWPLPQGQRPGAKNNHPVLRLAQFCSGNAGTHLRDDSVAQSVLAQPRRAAASFWPSPPPGSAPPHSILLEYSKGNPRNPKFLPVNTFQCTSLKYERPGTGATPRAHAAGPRGGAALPWGGLGRPRPDLGVCPAPPHPAGRGCRRVDRVPGEPRRSPGAGGATPRLPLRRVPAASRPCRRCG